METITLAQCALQRGVTYKALVKIPFVTVASALLHKAFAYVEGLNSSYVLALLVECPSRNARPPFLHCHFFVRPEN